MSRILIVEDSQILARNLALHLRRAGFDVDVCLYGEDARDMLCDSVFDAVCLDVRLPDLNGLDLLEDIKRTQPKLPVLIMSGESSTEIHMRAARLGALAFLTKPFELRKLREIIRAATGGGSLVGTCEPTGRAGCVDAIMYSHDGFGIGHMRRNTNIASRLVQVLPDVNVLMMCGSPSAGLFELPDGVDLLKLPSIVKVDTNTWRSRSLRISAQRIRDFRSRLILRTVELLSPKLFLVDHVPTGVSGELVPTLQMLRALRNPPKLVLGLRDILDAPEVVRRTWQRDGIFDAIETYYDEVLIYGRREVYDTAAAYGLDRLPPDTVRYCGYVCADGPLKGTRSVRELFDLASRKLVVVTAGGGQDAYPMMEVCQAALRQVDANVRPNTIFITGPLMPRQQRAAVENQAAGLPMRVLTSVPDCLSYLSAADLVVTMGGYNSLMETVRLNKRTIVIPRDGPSAEQRIRTRMLAEMGAVRAVGIDSVTASGLAGVIQSELEAGPKAPICFGRDGTEEVVAHLASLLAHPEVAQSQALSAAGVSREAM